MKTVKTCRQSYGVIGGAEQGGVKAKRSARGVATPGIHGRTRDASGAAKLGNDAVVPTMGKQSGCQLRPLLGRAKMRANHRFLPGVLGWC